MISYGPMKHVPVPMIGSFVNSGPGSVVVPSSWNLHPIIYA